MEKKHLNTLKIASLTLMLGCFAVGGVYNHYKEEQQEHVVKVERNKLKAPKQYASYDDNNTFITLSADELNSYTFEHFYDYIEDNLIYDFDIEYNNVNYQYEDGESNGSIEYIGSGNYINFVYDKDTFNDFHQDNFKNYQFVYNTTQEGFEYDLVMDFSSTTEEDYLNIKTAIELDIQANQPVVSMGESIIEAITSGLGLIGDLASEFLTGFSTLFWNATANSGNGALTDFGLFSLVFLGIAITMAIIKLCLNILRGSTGA